MNTEVSQSIPHTLVTTKEIVQPLKASNFTCFAHWNIDLFKQLNFLNPFSVSMPSLMNKETSGVSPPYFLQTKERHMENL